MTSAEWKQASDSENKKRNFSLLFSASVLLLCFGGLASRLFYLQILQGEDFERQARSTYTYIMTEAAPRGIIYDREGRVLASNKQSASLVVLPAIVIENGVGEIAARLAPILDEAPAKLKAEILALKRFGLKPVIWRKKLSIDQIAQIFENQLSLPGLNVQEEANRHYAYGEALAHVIGYTGQIDEKELGASSERSLNDIIGKYGLEKSYDATLRGQDAKHLIDVDHRGQPVQEVNFNSISANEPKSGSDLQLTLDLDLQKLAYEKLGELKGAVIMVDIPTGEVLALVSKPSFDPNIFTGQVKPKQWQDLNLHKVFVNRAISPYAPGSIWKPLVLLSALETGAVKKGEKLAVSGAYFMNGVRFGDWTSKTGIMGLTQALAWSRDTAFYRMAVRMKADDITSLASKFGYGQKTGLEIPGEKEGDLPSKDWLLKRKISWYPGNTLHYSIGQGYLTVTPAQAVRMTVGIASGGTLPRLKLVKAIGESIPERLSDEQVELKAESLKIVQAGMSECVQSGTCQVVKNKDYLIAGKTGSAEAPPNKKTHGWFISYAPADNPKVAIAVFAEAAGHGGAVAAPIAKPLLELYFKKYLPKPVPVSPAPLAKTKESKP